MTMTATPTIDPALTTALDRIADFIRQVTGIEPTASEIADALTRYFVLNEIKDHVLMLREGAAGAADNR
jgi:hypothetical protein